MAGITVQLIFGDPEACNSKERCGLRWGKSAAHRSNEVEARCADHL